MIYLDTHVVVWLYAADLALFPPAAKEALESNALAVSPAVLLELQYLREIKRITQEPLHMVHALAGSIGLEVCQRPFYDAVAGAIEQGWTRDPFDRIIVGTAAYANTPLLTKDATILRHYPAAFWNKPPHRATREAL